MNLASNIVRHFFQTHTKFPSLCDVIYERSLNIIQRPSPPRRRAQSWHCLDELRGDGEAGQPQRQTIDCRGRIGGSQTTALSVEDGLPPRVA